MMPIDKESSYGMQLLSSLSPMNPIAKDVQAGVRPTSPLRCSTLRWRQEMSCYICPTTDLCQSEYQGHDGCCTEQDVTGDHERGNLAILTSNKIANQINQGIPNPLAPIDSVYFGSLDPFATFSSVFPPEVINSCLMYRKY